MIISIGIIGTIGIGEHDKSRSDIFLSQAAAAPVRGSISLESSLSSNLSLSQSLSLSSQTMQVIMVLIMVIIVMILLMIMVMLYW